MNRRDFETLTRAIKAAWPDTVTGLQGYEARRDVALRLSRTLVAEGCAGFNEAAFLKGCGVINGAS